VSLGLVRFDKVIQVVAQTLYDMAGKAVWVWYVIYRRGRIRCGKAGMF